MSDLDMLKVITDADASESERWTCADQAVHNIMHVLYLYDRGEVPWGQLYGAIKGAYVGEVDWSTGDE